METPSGPYRLPKLPYSVQSFGEFLSRESFSYHYEKHHQAYLDGLNELIQGSPRENQPLEEIIRVSAWGEAKLFNQAAQAWNHAFYWRSMTPDRTEPGGRLKDLIELSFETIENFGRQWVEKGIARFGSGWVWLVVNEEEKLSVLTTSNAENPILFRQKPLICADVWEHAYYIDHRDDRKRFLSQWLSHIDWRFAAENLAAVEVPRMGATMRAGGG